MKRRLLSFVLLGSLLLTPVSAMAASSSSSSSKGGTGSTKTEDISQAITQSYNAETQLQPGIIVHLKDKANALVEPLKEADGSKILGVVVAPNASAVTLIPADSTQQQVFVATSGHYPVLVSTQNGGIKPGDYITISAITGVGMKADESQSTVLGKAVDSFTGTKGVISSIKLKDQLGHDTTVEIGLINVDLSITHNPLQQKATDFLPGFMAKAATTIAAKPVSAARIYLGLAVLLVSAFITANIVYSGVRSGMAAIGRNPLSKKSIIKSLIQTIMAGLIVFIVGLFAVYLMLKL